MYPVLTYGKYIELDANIPHEQERNLVQVRYNAKTGWYKLFGHWAGKRINIDAPDFPRLTEATKRNYGLQLPRRKDFIFCHQYKHFRFAIMQGYIPGYSCMIDVSGLVVKRSDPA